MEEVNKYKQDEEQLTIYGYEDININVKKDFRITIKTVRKGLIICRRVRLSKPSNLILPNAGVIYDENCIFEALIVGEDPDNAIDIRVGDMFIAKSSSLGHTFKNTVICINEKDYMAYELVNTFDVLCKVDYGKVN